MNLIHTPTRLISFMVWNSSKGLQREMDLTLRYFDLTYVQFLILLTIQCLNEEQKFVSQTDIADYLSTNKNIISQCLKRLHNKNLIRKTSHPADQRSKILFLTELGDRRLLQTSKLIQLKDMMYFKFKLSGKRSFSDQLDTLSSINSVRSATLES